MDMLKLSQNAQVPQPLRGMEYEKDKGPKEIWPLPSGSKETRQAAACHLPNGNEAAWVFPTWNFSSRSVELQSRTFEKAEGGIPAANHLVWPAEIWLKTRSVVRFVELKVDMSQLFQCLWTLVAQQTSIICVPGNHRLDSASAKKDAGKAVLNGSRKPLWLLTSFWLLSGKPIIPMENPPFVDVWISYWKRIDFYCYVNFSECTFVYLRVHFLIDIDHHGFLLRPWSCQLGLVSSTSSRWTFEVARRIKNCGVGLSHRKCRVSMEPRRIPCGKEWIKGVLQHVSKWLVGHIFELSYAPNSRKQTAAWLQKLKKNESFLATHSFWIMWPFFKLYPHPRWWLHNTSYIFGQSTHFDAPRSHSGGWRLWSVDAPAELRSWVWVGMRLLDLECLLGCCLFSHVIWCTRKSSHLFSEMNRFKIQTIVEEFCVECFRSGDA